MGTVFLASHVETGEPCALKLLSSEGLGDEDRLERFRREIETLSRFEHPNIVRILPSQSDRSTRFFAMEYVEGRSVAEIITDKGPIHWKQVIDYGIQICHGLKNAHDHGIVHRDLKPANLLVDSAGVLKIADFGIAKLWGLESAAHTQLTQTGVFVGTAEYMSPEQAKGESASIASDIYSLGAVMYAMLAGRPPFGATSCLKLCQMVIADPVVPVSEHNPRVPLELEQLVGQLLEKQAENRPGSAYSVLKSLERMQQDFSEKGPTFRLPSQEESAPVGSSYSPLVATMIAADDTEPADNASQGVEDVRQADRIIGRPAKEGLAAKIPFFRFRDSSTSFLIPLILLVLFGLVLVFNYCFYSATPGSAPRPNAKSTRQVRTSPIGRVVMSSDGERNDETLKVSDAQSGQETLTLKGFSGLVYSVSFSPDGKRIVFAYGEYNGDIPGAMKIWDTETERETLTLKGHSGLVASVSFSPDGKQIVSGSHDRTVKVWDAETGEETLTLKGHSGLVFGTNFSPDGKRIVSGSYDHTMKVWDAETGQETLTLKGHRRCVPSMSFSPDGKRIVSGSHDKMVKVWDAESGRETLTLNGHTDSVTSVSFSPDGKRIASGSRDKTVKVWDTETGQETLTLRGHSGLVRSVSFSPDGKRIVSGGYDQTVKVWDTPVDEVVED
jgi:serine/threonine protein kinase